MGCGTSIQKETKPQAPSSIASEVQHYNDGSKLAQKNTQDIIRINIKSKELALYPRFKCDFFIDTSYLQHETLGNVFARISKHVNNKHKPIKLTLAEVSGFVGYIDQSGIDSKRHTSIVNYSRSEIIKKGLDVRLKIQYEHKVIDTLITCDYMKKKKTNNPLQCPVYHAMKQKYEFTQENLDHVNNYQHYSNEVEDKPPCNHGQKCNAYIRSENGKNRLNDNCHMKIYRHPPRPRNIRLAPNIHSLIINQHEHQNQRIYTPTKEDNSMRGDNDGFLRKLIEEVTDNGFRSDLCLECEPNDDCRHKIYYSASNSDENDSNEENNPFALIEEIIAEEEAAKYQYSILNIVDQKLEHHRHKAMGNPLTRGQMLSLVLYTGCDCNYDLCKEQRKGNYKKWKWFDYCLYTAIFMLSNYETGCFSVYSGLNKVKLAKKIVPSGYFVTYVSSSWRKDVAKSFTNADGMLIQIDEAYKNNKNVWCCDVSWISKFPDECEVLFARSNGETYHTGHGFNCIVLDDSNGIQTVSLKRCN